MQISLLNSVRSARRSLFGLRNGIVPTETDPATGLKRRIYATYDDYLRHQASKLEEQRDNIEASDLEYEHIVRERYGSIRQLEGAQVLCLAARLGGEVRAFKSLGALAIGIDIAPGPGNAHVLYGDVHALQFPDNVFDIIFTNAFDHFLEPVRVLEESSRVLKPRGRIVLELAQNAHPSRGNREVVDMRETEALLSLILQCFSVESTCEITNVTSYVKWKGLNVIGVKK